MLTRRSVWRGAVAAIALSSLALLVVVLLSTRHGLIEAWRRFQPLAFVAGAACIVLVWAAKAGRMHVLARAMGFPVGVARFWRIYMITSFVSHITPFNAGGVPMQVYLTAREGMPLGTAAAVTAVDLGLNLAAILLVIPAALLLRRSDLPLRMPGWFAWVAVALFALILAGFVWRRFGRSERGAARWRGGWRREFGLFKLGLKELVARGPGAAALALGLTLAYWLFYLALAPIILLGLGVRAGFGYVLAGQLVFNFLQVLLPTPGGSGGSELFLLAIFGPLLAPGQAGVFILLWKLYTFHATLVLGGIFAWRALAAGRGRRPGERETPGGEGA